MVGVPVGVPVAVGVAVLVAEPTVAVEVNVGVIVGVFVRVGVLEGVFVRVAVGGVPVTVGVFVPQGGWVNISNKPLVGPATLHSYCVTCGPVPFCTPIVALLRSPIGVPYTT